MAGEEIEKWQREKQRYEALSKQRVSGKEKREGEMRGVGDGDGEMTRKRTSQAGFGHECNFNEILFCLHYSFPL